MDGAEGFPEDRSRRIYRATERHPLVTELLETLCPGEPPVATDVAAGDEMFRYLLALRHGHRDRALVDYFRTGHAAASVLGPLVRSVVGEGSILDFAAGWGRVTRFLVQRLPEARWWVSDVSPGSVEFQREALGVRGFPSAGRPEDLAAPGRFDAILVSSLFTHLPRSTFGRWLARLWSLVDDGGALIFSTHDVSTLPEGEEPEADGFRFLERSEIDTLSKQEYGESWVSEDFVAQRLAELDPPVGSWRRLPRGLWHFQDLYVAVRGRELPSLDFDPGPRGQLEAATLEGGERLWLEGWVDEGALDVRLNGRPAATLGAVDRPGPERGWMAKVEPPEGDFLRPTDLLRVGVVTPSGRRRVLHLSTIEDLLAELRERDLRAELDFAYRELHKADAYLQGNVETLAALEARIAAMEASRFWKLRNAWFRLKRGLGLEE